MLRANDKGLAESMARGGQGNLFRADEQPDLFGNSSPPAYRPDPEKVRARLYKFWPRRGRRRSCRGSRRASPFTARFFRR